MLGAGNASEEESEEKEEVDSSGSYIVSMLFWMGCLLIRVGTLDGGEISITTLNRLRDEVLSGDFQTAVKAAVNTEDDAITVAVDVSRFAEMYERHILRLDKLTPHQSEKLDQCLSSHWSSLHVVGPAGSGKTFVALHVILDFIYETISE